MRTAHETRTVRLWIIACFAGVAALVAALLGPLSASAATVELTGTVTGPTGSVISGISVSAVQITLGIPTTIATTTTGSTGKYTFSALADANDYSLYFGASSKTFPQYLGDTSASTEAQIFSLSLAGGSHSTINAALVAGGTISGTVKSITHAALKGYTVRAYANGVDDTIVRSGVSSSSGAYSITGLEPGLYQLEAIDTAANPPYGPVYSGAATTLDAASAVRAIAGTTTSYSFTLGKAGAISGTVTGETNDEAQPLADVTVTPYLLEGTSPSFTGSSSLGLTPVVTNAEGQYSIKGLMPGYYTLEFTPGGSTPQDPVGSVPYGRALLGNESYEIQQATPLHVVGGTTLTGTDQELYRSASVTVTVEDSGTNAPISNIQVSLAHENESVGQTSDGLPTGITDSNGQVTFEGVGAGYYDAVVGSNLGTDGTITTYQREVVFLSNQVLLASSTSDTVTATLKAAGGLQPTSTPTFGCCGAPPYAVEDEIGVDPYLVSWNASDVDPTKITAQWYRNGVAIPGATNTLYNLQAADAGTMITETITAYDLAYGSGSASTAAVGPIEDGTLYYYGGGGAVSGADQVGKTLTYSDVDGWSQAGVVETDVWQRSTDNGSTWHPFTPQPTNNTYVPVATDVGDQIRVEVTGAMPGYTTVTYDTDPETIYQGQITLLKQPKVTASSTKWTATDGTWSPNVGTTNYVWVIYDKTTGVETDLPPTTVPTLSRAAYSGDFVGMRANRDPTGYSIEYSNLLTVQLGVAPTPSGAATITGTPEFGVTLTAHAPTFVPPVSTVNCQWQYKSGSSWKNVSGASACTYTPIATDIGRVLRVEETTSLTGFASKTLTATEPTAVVAAALTNVLAPTISTPTGTGDLVTASVGLWSSTPTSYTYHWLYSTTGMAPFKAAPGSTNQSSYTIPQSLLDDTLEVQVTANLSGHAAPTATSTTHPVIAGQLTALTNPKVSLSGTTLTASGGTFSPAAAVAYQWYYYSSNDTTLNALGSPTTTPLSISAHLHDHIAVQAVGTLSGYTSNAPLVLAKKGDEEHTGTLTIAGNLVGAPVVSGGVTWSITDSNVTYQWQYESGSTWKSISGATLQAYAPTGTYLGKTIRVQETASHTNYNSATVTSSNTETVTAGNAPTPGSGGSAPTLSGTNQVDDTLSVTPGTWNPTTTTYTYSYQWRTSTNDSAWTNIAGATSSHLVVPQSAWLASDYIDVVITASKTGYTPGTTTLDAEKTAEGSISLITAPKVTTSGTKLTVSNGTWKHATSYQYQWQTETPAGVFATLSGEITNSYTPGVGEDGDAIYAVVNAHDNDNDNDYTTYTAEVLARSGGPITSSGAISVTGTANTASTLTASWTSFSVTSPTVGYQWYRSGTKITGATNQTYAPGSADIGKTLSVTLTVSKLGFTTEKFTATSPVIQSATSIDNITDPTISGTPVVDGLLTASAVKWNESGVTTSYQWNRDGFAIPGATHSTYTPTAADLGMDIFVTVMGSKQYQTTAYATSGTFSIGEGAAMVPKTALKITGTVGIGKTLSASLGSFSLPVTLTYEWQYTTSSSFADIPGANASTYTLSTSDESFPPGSKIQLIVHASRPGHATAVLTSQAVTVP
jgi:hypothetical protein